MKTKTFLFLLLILLIAGNIFAQEETSSRTFAVKNYFSLAIEANDKNFFFANEDYTLTDSNQVFKYHLFRPTFNIFSKHGFLHEFEISEFQFSKDDKSVVYEYFNPDSISSVQYDFVEIIRRFSFKYSFNLPVVRKSNYSFFLGAGIQPFFERKTRDELPDEEFFYTKDELKTIGVNFHLAPRLIFPIKEKLFIDVNVLLPFLKIENTKYSQTIFAQKSVYEKDINQFLKGVFEFSIGIGYKL